MPSQLHTEGEKAQRLNKTTGLIFKNVMCFITCEVRGNDICQINLVQKYLYLKIKILSERT